MWYYDFEVFKYDWLVVFRKSNKKKDRRIVINDVEALKEVLLEIGTDLLGGFNNYGYDDTIMAAILMGKDPYIITQRLIENGERELNWQLKLEAPMTIDFKQELPLNLSLKKIEANRGKAIVESKVPFNIQRKLTDDEIEDVVKYCDVDVLELIELSELPERLAYFSAKVGIIKMFNLPQHFVKFTRAKLMAFALKCDKKVELPNDRLLFEYINPLELDNISPAVVKFYERAKHDFRGGGDYKEIEKRQFIEYIDGVPHTYGFGGLHGAKLGYSGKGFFVHADFESYYPNLIIIYEMMSRKTNEPHIFEDTYKSRMRYKRAGDSRQQPLKIGINAVFGALKSEFNPLFDPKFSNEICINGQLVITELAQRLMAFGDLIQTNTDGVIFKLDDPQFKEEFMEECELFRDEFGINLENHYISEIHQRDVNNYIFKMFPTEKHPEGEIEAIGMFKRWDESKLFDNFQSNSYAIVDIAMKRFYMDGIAVEDTVLDLYEKNHMLAFQLVTSKGSTYYKMVHEENGEFVDVENSVNRVFASRDKTNGIMASVKSVPKVIKRVKNGTRINKNGKEVANYDEVYEYDENGDVVMLDSFNKVPNCPDYTIIHNDHIDTFDKRNLDLQFYVDLCNDAKF